ncbi:Gp49 family protein [Comamonas sp. J-3]|uniref:Gp49 family protein n=1 Tax=Comamonas trifloxystrobinivorans TaxID=3350256 RepID=UPI003726C2E6
MDDSQIEEAIQAAGKTAPRVTPADIEAEINSETYFTAQHGVEGAMSALELHSRHPGGTPVNLCHITFCVLTLKNGTKLVGVNEGPVSPENFDPEIGRKLARQKAIDQVWPMLGFRLRDELARPVLTEADSLADLNGTPRPSAGVTQ